MKKNLAVVMLSIVCSLILFAGTLEDSPHQASIDVDFAYYPLSTALQGADHFAPLTGPYSGLEFRVVGNYGYKIPVPFGDNPLVKGNYLTPGVSLELSPVSIAPMASLSFSPVAFLIFNTGAKVGAAWDFIGVQGLGAYNPTEKKYESISPFSSAYYNTWLEGVFQFDLAAVLPGEWNHVVAVASYKLFYEGISGSQSTSVWKWQGVGEKANGLHYSSNFILGYQMPLVLQTVGLQVELSGTYAAPAYNDFKNWNPSFMTVGINPVFVFKFDKHNSLLLQLGFNSRRSFSTGAVQSDKPVLELTHVGREWYFNRIALSYTYAF